MFPEYPSDAYANALNRLRVPQLDMACHRHIRVDLLRRVRRGPPQSQVGGRNPIRRISELNHTASTSPCLRFVPSSLQATQDSVLTVCQTLSDGSLTRWVLTQIFNEQLSVIRSHLTGLCMTQWPVSSLLSTP